MSAFRQGGGDRTRRPSSPPSRSAVRRPERKPSPWGTGATVAVVFGAVATLVVVPLAGFLAVVLVARFIPDKQAQRQAVNPPAHLAPDKQFVVPREGGPQQPQQQAVKKDEGPKAEQPKPTPKQETLPDLSKVGIKQGDVTVTVLSASIGKVNLRSFSSGQSKEDLFQVAVRITNNHKTRRLDYHGWAQTFGSDNASLQDEHGNRYKLIDFGLATRIEGGVGSATINPGESVTDVLVFEKPLAVATQLTLRLPLAAVQDQSGEIRGTVPKDFRR
jgi:hypothetical protein